MKLHAGIAILLSSICFLAGCETTTQPPDIQSIQPTQQDQERAKMSNSIQSLGL
jgi:hypothetical protein